MSQSHFIRSWSSHQFRSRPAVCPSLLGKSLKFITGDSYLLRRLRILEEAGCATPDLLIRGEHGVGKKTLALHSWRVRRLSSSLIRGKGQFVNRRSHIDRLLADAGGGDLFFDNIDNLSTELQEYLFVASNNVRIIATAPAGYQPHSSDRFLLIDVPPLSKRLEDKSLIISYLAERFDKKIASDLCVKLNFTTTGKLYLFVVNLALASDCLGSQTIDHAIVNEVLSYSDDELLQNYFIFFTARVGLAQLLNDHGLRQICKLSEQAYLHSSMIENGYNISRVSQALSVPLATLSRKMASLAHC